MGQLSGHRAPWDDQDNRTLYRMIADGRLQSEIAERLGRTARAIKWKIWKDRTSAAAVAGNLKGYGVLADSHSQAVAGDRRSPPQAQREER